MPTWPRLRRKGEACVCVRIEKGERDPRSQRPNPVGNPNSIRAFVPTRFSKNDHDSHLLDCADTLIKARARLSRKQSESPIAPAHSTPPLHFASDSRVPQAVWSCKLYWFRIKYAAGPCRFLLTVHPCPLPAARGACIKQHVPRATALYALSLTRSCRRPPQHPLG